MKHHPQRTREERYQIYALKAAEQSKARIAEVLGRHKATIGRERARNCGLQGSRPRQVDSLAGMTPFAYFSNGMLHLSKQLH